MSGIKFNPFINYLQVNVTYRAIISQAWLYFSQGIPYHEIVPDVYGK